MHISTSHHSEEGFTLIELLVSAVIFTFIMIGVSELFINSLDLQQRAAATQKIQENAQYVIESVAREVRVSTVQGGTPTSLTIQHPVNGTVVYRFNATDGSIERESDANGNQRITSSDVVFTDFQFKIAGAGADGRQARVTMPMTITATVGHQTVSVSLQTTVTSRDVFDELTRP